MWAVETSDGRVSLRFRARLPSNPFYAHGSLILVLTAESTREQAEAIAEALNSSTSSYSLVPEPSIVSQGSLLMDGQASASPDLDVSARISKHVLGMATKRPKRPR